MAEEPNEDEFTAKHNWLVIGITIGAAGGLLMDNLALGVVVGATIGLLMNYKKAKQENKNGEE